MNPDVLCDTDDVANYYRLFLGREPENFTVQEEKFGRSLRELFPEFVGCDEFNDHVAHPVLAGRQFAEGRFSGGNNAKLRAWVVDRLEIQSIAIRESTTAPQLLSAVMMAPGVRDLLSNLSTSWSLDDLTDALRTAREGTHYDRSMLHLMLNRIYDLPDVRVDATAPSRINVLVPAFEFKSMSAGFFGVFQIARFIASCGHRVRLVLFDNFAWNDSEFRDKLSGYPEMEHLYEEMEIEYIGQRLQPLQVSPNDRCVATVWYSAYFADKIMALTSGRPFLYLIQDYETRFYAGSSQAAIADATYSMNFTALFSSEALQNAFLNQGIGVFAHRWPGFAYFNNACSSTLLRRGEFMARQSRTRVLALYSRPVVPRNMFELAALSLIRAVEEGVFDEGEWAFYGIGLGDAKIDLPGGGRLEQLPRMNLRDYQAMVAGFDLGLSLMASPHPSLLPFDLGGSGAIVVTNTWQTKQQEYFTGICDNIIAKPPTVATLVDGLRAAVVRVEDFAARYQAAIDMRYPRTWAETFGPEHRAFVAKVFGQG